MQNIRSLIFNSYRTIQTQHWDVQKFSNELIVNITCVYELLWANASLSQGFTNLESPFLFLTFSKWAVLDYIYFQTRELWSLLWVSWTCTKFRTTNTRATVSCSYHFKLLQVFNISCWWELVWAITSWSLPSTCNLNCRCVSLAFYFCLQKSLHVSLLHNCCIVFILKDWSIGTFLIWSKYFFDKCCLIKLVKIRISFS